MSNKLNHSMSLANPDAPGISTKQKIGLAAGIVGLFIFVLALANTNFPNEGLFLALSLVLITGGTVVYANGAYMSKLKGIKNDGVWFKSISSRGFWGWTAGIILTVFYVILYFYAELLGLGTKGESNTGLISLFDPMSKLISGRPASQWFVYGALYTIAVIAFGIKYILKYRHNKYQQLRTGSVMFFQLGFAFLIPEFMYVLNSDLPYYNLTKMWPLDSYLFHGYSVKGFLSAGNVGLGLLLFGILSIFVISPFLTYKYGKRWYCSWVCGCGGLAETAGDSFRHLSDKTKSAWKVERWVIHSVLVFAVVSTTAIIHSYLGNDTSKFWLTKDSFLIGVSVFLTVLFAVIWIFKRQELQKDARYGAIGYLVVILAFVGLYYTGGESGNVFFWKESDMRTTYGFLIGSIFSGVVGTGFYPILGNRVWCRMGCPMAAILGMQQRLFSKFRITTNGGQCISCGNCSTYCEMGIDVRSYAQKGENIVRSSCVGCGVCSAVCPRGVLKLENGNLEGRINPTQVLLGNDVDLMDLVNKK